MKATNHGLFRCLAVDLLLTALAPAILETTYIVTSQFLPPDRLLSPRCCACCPPGLRCYRGAASFRSAVSGGKLIITGILNIGAFQALLFIAATACPAGWRR